LGPNFSVRSGPKAIRPVTRTVNTPTLRRQEWIYGEEEYDFADELPDRR
jgi:hypothetical protein